MVGGCMHNDTVWSKNIKLTIRGLSVLSAISASLTEESLWATGPDGVSGRATASHVICGSTRRPGNRQSSQSVSPNWKAGWFSLRRDFCKLQRRATDDCLKHTPIRYSGPRDTRHTHTPSPRPIIMGFWDTVTDLLEAATPWAVAEAEAPVAQESVCVLSLLPRHPSLT